MGLGVEGQKVLDIGTGTGVLPRNMYSYGEKWTGTDISPEQIEQAKLLSGKAGMDIDYYAISTEDIDFPKPKKDNVRCAQCKEDFYDLEIAEINTPGGNGAKVHSIERTLCNILRPHSVDIQVMTEAFECYVKRENKNIPVLSGYENQLKVEKRLRAYLEVWL